jgi:DNA-binding NarL/FixJ family response regulator
MTTTNAHGKNGPSGRERAPLALVWIRSGSQLTALSLEKELSAVARVHKGQAAPSGETPSAVILCLEQAEDVVSEVGRARAVAPDAAVLVYAPFADLALAREAIGAGASGLLHTGIPSQEIRRAVSVALEGETVLPRKLLSMWLEERRRTDPNLVLRPRQLEILRLASEGLTNAQIARNLYLAESTVKQHLRAAYEELGVRNRNEAAGLLRRHEGGRKVGP